MTKLIIKCATLIASAFALGLAFAAFVIGHYLNEVESAEIEYI